MTLEQLINKLLELKATWNKDTRVFIGGDYPNMDKLIQGVWGEPETESFSQNKNEAKIIISDEK
jgi:hypothetical protein